MIATAFEDEFDDGKRREMERAIQLVLQARFGPLSPTARKRLANYPVDKLEDLMDAAVRTRSLKDLGLQD
jgi:hypothetical protein